jgi:hypothetical protein
VGNIPLNQSGQTLFIVVADGAINIHGILFIDHFSNNAVGIQSRQAGAFAVWQFDGL